MLNIRALVLIGLISILQTALSFKVSASEYTFMGLGAPRDSYHSHLLSEVAKLASDSEVSFRRYEKDITHDRAFKFLEDAQELDIVVGYASTARDEKHQAVAIPILKGLNGWRLSLVHKDNVDLFKNVKNLREFRRFVPGQLETWADYDILKANRISPSGAADFNSLYHMLHKKRSDYLPRSALEIDREVATLVKSENLNVVVEPHILMFYPTAIYFYVHKDNKDLATLLNDGLEAIIANGEFDKIFHQHYGEIVERIRNQQRQRIALDNPFLPESVPLDRKELWLH